MFFEVHILFFPCPDLYAPAFTLSSTYRLSLVTNSRLREGNLSFPSVERTLGVLLLWAKPLSFYPEAIDGRCWRGCLSFVFLSELQGEVGHLEGERTGVWGRDTRRKGGRLTEIRKSRKAEHLFPEKQQLLLVIQRTVHVPPFDLPEFMSGAWHFWCGRSVIRQGYVKGSQPTGE